MPYSAKRNTRTVTALLISTILSAGYVSSAYAQTPGSIPPPPVRRVIDENGVDVIRGTMNVAKTDVSIGPSDPQGLAYTSINLNAGWSSALRSSITKVGSTFLVTLDGESDSFTQSGSTFTPTEGNGATLTLAGAIYTYTSRNGSIATFQSNSGGFPFFDAPWARATSITYPDGTRTAFTYKILQYCPNGVEGGTCPAGYRNAIRLQSVTNNRGYQLKFSYASNTLNDLFPASIYDKWSELVSVKGINNGNEYCDPAADTCSLAGSWPTATYTRSAVSGGTQLIATNPANDATRYTSDSSFRLTAIKRPGAATDNVVIGYGADGVSSVTRDGVLYSYGYVTAGTVRTTTVTDPNSGQNVYVSDTSTYRLTSYRDPLNRTTSYLYDGSGRVTRVTAPEGNYTEYTYDARGNVSSVKHVAKPGSGLADIITSSTFLASCTNAKTCNKPTTTTDAKSNVTDYTYDSGHGGLLTVTAPAPTTGAVRPQQRFTYTPRSAYYKNSSGSIVASAFPVSVLTNISACQTLSSCTGAADETKTTVDYGPQVAGTANNLLPVSVTSGSGDASLSATIAATYDNVGNRLTIDGPLAGNADTTRTRFDAARRVVGVVGPDPDGGGARKHLAQRLSYNTDGQVITAEIGTVNSQSDPDWAAFASAEAVTTTYDVNARRSKDALSGSGTALAVSQYSFDALGRLDCTAQRMNPAIFGSLPASACTLGTAGSGGNDFGSDRIVKNTYDAASQLTKVQTAFGSAEQADEVTTGYSNNGKVSHVVDAENNRTGYSYDGHDRLAKTEYPMPTKGSNAANPSDYEQLAYDANGNVTSRRLRDGNSIGYGYDNINRLISKDLPGSEPDATYSYDLLNRPLSANQSGQTLGFTHDALSRNLAQSGPLGTITYAYDTAGRRISTTYPGGAALTANYDRDVTGNVTAIKENGSTALATYTYDNLSRRSSVTYGNGVVQSFAYDAVSRLSNLTSNLGGTAQDQTVTFGYNPSSQIDTLSKTNDSYAWNGHYNVDRVSVGNGLNQLLATTPSGGQISVPTLGYDSKGNLTAIGSSSYAYSSENFFKTAPGSVTLDYDPVGRLYQTSGGTATRFQYDGVNLIAEYNGSNALQRRYIHGPGADEPILWYEGSGLTDKRYLTADERGSIVAVTNSIGTSIGINTYDEYGNPGSGNIGRFGYTGQTWLPEIGLWYYKARMYNPGLGRFMQTDPIGYQDGMNSYNYVGSDPVNMTDPTGLGTYCGVVDTSHWEGQAWQSIWIVSGLKICHEYPDARTDGRGDNFGYGSALVVLTQVVADAGVRVQEIVEDLFCALPPLEVSGGADAYLGIGASADLGISFDLRTLQVRGSVGGTLGVGLGGGVGIGASRGATETGFATEISGTLAAGPGSLTVSRGEGALGIGPKFGPQFGAWGGVSGQYTSPATADLTGACNG